MKMRKYVMKKRMILALTLALTAIGAWAQDTPEEPKEIDLTWQELQLVVQNNNFAFNLFRKARENKDMVISPLSVTYALGLVNNGAEGDTRWEINMALGTDSYSTDELNNFCHKMLTESNTLDELTQVNIANAIFLNEPCSIYADFEEKARTYYNAHIETRDFTDGETMNVINQWASDETNGMIQDLLNEGSFNPLAISYLLNAIYFKGTWTLKFDKDETVDEPFNGGAEVPMMHMHNLLPYTENDIYQMVTLPYGNQAYQMNVLLPREGRSIADVVNSLNGRQWQNSFWLPIAEVDVKMPRIETETDLPLVDIMKKLGVTSAFSAESAQFPGFYHNIDGNAYIKNMQQKAKIQLDEEGTEAAAVTIIMETGEGIEEPEESKQYEFHANRPFLYVISERSSGAIFFIGQYVADGEDLNERHDLQMAEEEKQLISANNDFAFKLFRKARTEENKVLSPLSITMALGMLNNGASGQTRQEICNTLGFGDAGADAINAFCHKMMTEGTALDQKTTVNIANTIFVNEPYKLLPDFVQKANDYYDAQPETRDFADDETLDVINQWASDHTEGMIPKVLTEDQFDPAAVSYLLNAIYLKGEWATRFDKNNTKDEPFNGGQVVPMMFLDEDFPYYETETYQAVKLPYGNKAYDMTVLLPHEGKTVADVLDALDGQTWEQLGKKMVKYELYLKLPRFETETDQNLKDIMSDLGMPSAFNGQTADFSAFCTIPTFIGLMKQNAKIQVDEEGSVAAAVTVVGAIPLSAGESFFADRPFLYIISEQSTGVIFFIGQYMGPGDPSKPDNNDSTGIESSHTAHPSPLTPVYDLQGRRISPLTSHRSPLKKGLYVTKGRKFVVK